MAEEHDRIVQSYMEKVLALRRERELEEIALQSGLSREDLDYARKSFQDYLNRGKDFLQYNNWERASRELEHAVALSPNNSTALFHLAMALWNVGVVNRDKGMRFRATQYADCAIQLDSTNTEAIRLITHMTEYTDGLFSTQSKRTTWLSSDNPQLGSRILILLLIVMLVISIGICLAVLIQPPPPPYVATPY